MAKINQVLLAYKVKNENIKYTDFYRKELREIYVYTIKEIEESILVELQRKDLLNVKKENLLFKIYVICMSLIFILLFIFVFYKEIYKEIVYLKLLFTNIFCHTYTFILLINKTRYI